MHVLSVRTAVDAQQQRNLGARRVARRLGQEAMHLRAVSALEADLFGSRDLQPGEQRVVLTCELAQRAALHGINLRGLCGAARKDGGATRCDSRTRHDDRRRHQPLDAAAGKFRSRRIHGAVIGDQERDRFSIRAETRRGNAPVEIVHGSHPRGRAAPVRGHDRQMIHVIGAVFFLVALEERDPFAVGAPFQARTPAAAALMGQLPFRSARLRLRHENLARRLAIRVFRVVAHEGDASAVGRPGRRRFVPFAGGQPVQFLRRDLEQVNVAVPS